MIAKQQEVKRNSQEHEAMVRVQREKIQSGWKKDKRSEGEFCISRRGQMGQIEQWRYTSWRSPRRTSQTGICEISKKAGRAAPGVRAAKSSESRNGE